MAEIEDRCEHVGALGTQCNRKRDGEGTRYCYQHHRMHFGEALRHDANGCIAGRAEYLGHHGHLNR